MKRSQLALTIALLTASPAAAQLAPVTFVAPPLTTPTGKSQTTTTKAAAAPTAAPVPISPLTAQGSSILAVHLPDNAKLNRPLSVVLPSGAPLPTVLKLITAASGLILVGRDIPPLSVTMSFKGLTTRAALEQLLSLYQDQVHVKLIGDSLIVAPASIIDRLESTPGAERVVLSAPITDDDGKRLSLLTGAQVIPVNNTTIVSGTAAQIHDVQALLLIDPQKAEPVAVPTVTVTADIALSEVDPALAEKTIASLYGPAVTVTAAYGRAYLQATSQAALDHALVTLKQLQSDAKLASEATRVAANAATQATVKPVDPIAVPVPTIRRTLNTTLPADLVTRLAATTGSIKITPLDAGSYVVLGSAADLNDLSQALHDAETRDAIRVTVTYPHVPASATDGLKEAVPTITVRSTPGGLEVRGTPQEQLRASMYLNGIVRALPPEAAPAPVNELITVRIPLAYAQPGVIATQLASLYAPATPSATSVANAAPTVLPAPPAQAGTPSTPTPTAPVPAATPTASAGPDTTVTDVRIVSDERSRSILLSGPRSTVTRMQRTIADLDTRLQDVRMALKIEQISGSTGQDLGIDWNVGVGGFSIGQQAGTLTAGYKTGIAPLSITASLQAARSQGRANTLLDTTFVAQNGKPSNFKNGGQILLPSTSTATNGTVTNSRVSYDYGLDVTLTPRLAPDGRIELTVQVQLGDQPQSGVADSVVIAKRTMTSIVTVEPGEQLILGGVLSTQDSASSKGVPVLSEIPVIGALFGNKTAATSSSVLLITLQAADRSDARAPLSPARPSDNGVTRINVPGR